MNKDSRIRAIEAARELMMVKGKDGVRMQEIADHAGINKGLLHYYFKSKNNLFQEVFKEELESLFGHVTDLMKSENLLEEKISIIIDHYFNHLTDHGKRSSFVLFEINKDPSLVKLTDIDSAFSKAVFVLDESLKNHGLISSPELSFQVLMNIISLCVFPFMSEPLGKKFLKERGTNWRSLMNQRRDFLKNLILSSLRS